MGYGDSRPAYDRMSTPEDDRESALRDAVDAAERDLNAAHLRLQGARKALNAYVRGRPIQGLHDD
jgi:hypothetical protein